MKVLHLCLACCYVEGYSYQENLLPKHHKLLGYDVEIVASLESFDKNGRSTILPANQPSYYIKDGIRVTRLNYRGSGGPITRKLKRYEGLYNYLEESKPDILFIHGCQFADIAIVAKYVSKNTWTRVFVDNHADYSNSATNWVSKYVLHRVIWRQCAKIIEPYCEVFWGVLPARVDFLVENYGIAREHCQLLVMGADDTEVTRVLNEGSGQMIRERYGIEDDDFLIVTGGKIDLFKKETIGLIRAVDCANDEAIKLIVFGPIVPELQKETEQLFDGSRIIHVPWANSSQAYDYFSAADLVVFPGRHSVYWEQVVGLGKPIVVKRWPGTDHISHGENCIFLESGTEGEILDVIERLSSNPEAYKTMAMCAQRIASGFLYSDIAKKSLGKSID